MSGQIISTRNAKKNYISDQIFGLLSCVLGKHVGVNYLKNIMSGQCDISALK